MTELIAERPLIVGLMIGVIGLGLIYGWLQSGRKQLGWIGVLLLACIPVTWTASTNWVTDRELIEALIHQTADAVESNDHERALRIIGDPSTRKQAAAELPRYEFSTADVGSIREITIVEDSVPPRAEVDLNVVVELSSKQGSIQNLRVPRRLQLTFEKRPNMEATETRGWVVTGYQHMPIVGGPDGYTTSPYGQ